MIITSRLSAGDALTRWRRASTRSALPALVTLGMIVLMTVPLFASSPVLPQLGLLAVFVWASFQPALMPPWLAFVLGLAADALLALPFGVNATLYALCALGVRIYASRFGLHRYGFDWLVFVAFMLIYLVLSWQFLRFTGHAGPFAPMLLQLVTTAIAYPAVVAGAAWLQRRLAEPG